MVYFGINLLNISQGQLLIEMLLLGNKILFYFIFCQGKEHLVNFLHNRRTMFKIILFFFLVRVAIGLTGNGINRDGTDSTDPYDL